MSEPDDKSRADGSDNRPKSVFDSDWDTLLGDAASSASSRPIFAPPTSGLGSIAAIIKSADPSPRTSDAHASVSGEFVAPFRPEPTSPPRYEAPPGIHGEHDDEPGHELTTAELPREAVDSTPTPPEPEPEPAANPEPEPKLAKVIELGRAWPNTSWPTPSPSSPTPSASEPVASPVSSNADEPSESDPGEPDPAKPDPARSDRYTAAEFGGGSPGGPAASSRGVVVVTLALAVIGLAALAAKTLGVSEVTDDVAQQRPVEPPADDLVGPSDQPNGTETSSSGSGSGSGTETETGGGGTETGEGETGEAKDPRDPSVIPAGTPEPNAKAFLKLPVSIHDGPPIGGIGRTGLHIDSLATASGADNTECDGPASRFSIATAEYVNVCFRLVHPRGEVESLRIYWEKDGKVTRRSRVRVPEQRAYATRGYLMLRPEYVGAWRVRIVPEGEEDIELAVAEFEITE